MYIPWHFKNYVDFLCERLLVQIALKMVMSFHYDPCIRFSAFHYLSAVVFGLALLWILICTMHLELTVVMSVCTHSCLPPILKMNSQGLKTVYLIFFLNYEKGGADEQTIRHNISFWNFKCLKMNNNLNKYLYLFNTPQNTHISMLNVFSIRYCSRMITAGYELKKKYICLEEAFIVWWLP